MCTEDGVCAPIDSADAGQQDASVDAPPRCDDLPAGFLYLPETGHCYYRAEGGKKPGDGLAAACSLGPTDHPITVGAHEAELARAFAIAASDEHWIGLRSSSGTASADFRWPTGEASSFRRWATDFPKSGNGLCVIVRKDGDWENRQCVDQYFAICERE